MLSTLIIIIINIPFVSLSKLFVTTDHEIVLNSPGLKAVIAFVEYNDTLSTNGWTMLTVNTNGSYPDSDQARAAGLGEGYATAKRILQSWTNTMAGYCVEQSSFCVKLKKYIYTNKLWLEHMVQKKRRLSSYWYHIYLIHQQIQGLSDGFNIVYPGKLQVEDFYLMNLSGDLEDLEQAFGSTVTEVRARKREHMLGTGSCSALIKWIPGDILTSQITWNSYQSLIRIIKNYDFNFRISYEDTDFIPGKLFID